MSRVIDRRLNGKNKSAVNRQRFIKRFKRQIKKSINRAIAGRSITDIEKGENITIPKEDLSEPRFKHGEGGNREVINPGNKEFSTGDKIERPQKQGGQGSEASNQGEGDDEFVFQLSREEFLELFFEDMALPDLIKKEIVKVPSVEWQRAGFKTQGTPSSIHITRTMRNALARRIALSMPYKRKLREKEKELAALKNTHNEEQQHKRRILQQQIVELKKKIKATPYIDDFDVRYKNHIKVPKPSTQAVMFCLMDVSGSMDEIKKDIAKRFFILLYLFLTRNYKHIELVFIRHHTSAKEVDEHEFFYSRETGGTVVSSALELMVDVIKQRYPTNEWNIYAAQASDGDNWNADSPVCHDILVNQVMPLVQYFAYVEILPRHHQSLWDSYLQVKESFENFAMNKIDSQAEIYTVLHDLFKRQAA